MQVSTNFSAATNYTNDTLGLGDFMSVLKFWCGLLYI